MCSAFPKAILATNSALIWQQRRIIDNCTPSCDWSSSHSHCFILALPSLFAIRGVSSTNMPAWCVCVCVRVCQNDRGLCKGKRQFASRPSLHAESSPPFLNIGISKIASIRSRYKNQKVIPLTSTLQGECCGSALGMNPVALGLREDMTDVKMLGAGYRTVDAFGF